MGDGLEQFLPHELYFGVELDPKSIFYHGIQAKLSLFLSGFQCSASLNKLEQIPVCAPLSLLHLLIVPLISILSIELYLLWALAILWKSLVFLSPCWSHKHLHEISSTLSISSSSTCCLFSGGPGWLVHELDVSLTSIWGICVYLSKNMIGLRPILSLNGWTWLVRIRLVCYLSF